MLPVRSNLLPTVSRFFDDEWDNLFDWKTKNSLGSNFTMPAVNIHENEGEYCVEMAAPGLDKSNFKIELEKNRLSINYHSESSNEEKDKDDKFVRREYNFTSFSRSFHLNKSVVDHEGISANYNNGILSIIIPKKEEAKEKPPRLIDVA